MGHPNIGNAIREAREAVGLSRAGLAEKAGRINRLTVLRIETGETPNPRADTLKAIARALGCTVDSLLREPEPKRRAAGGRR